MLQFILNCTSVMYGWLMPTVATYVRIVWSHTAYQIIKLSLVIIGLNAIMAYLKKNK